MTTFADCEAEAHLASTPALAALLTKATPASASKMQAIQSSSWMSASVPAPAPSSVPALAPSPTLALAQNPVRAPALDPAPTPAPPPGVDLDQRLAQMEEAYKAQVAQLRAEFTTSANHSLSNKPSEPPTAPHYCQPSYQDREVINVDTSNLPSRHRLFDAFKVVRQYSTGFTADAATGLRLRTAGSMRSRQALFSHDPSQPIKWPEAQTWSIESHPANRARCTPEFKSLSHLLVHFEYATSSSAVLIPQSEVLFVRAQCSTFQSEVLIPAFITPIQHGHTAISSVHEHISKWPSIISTSTILPRSHPMNSLAPTLCAKCWI